MSPTAPVSRPLSRQSAKLLFGNGLAGAAPPRVGKALVEHLDRQVIPTWTAPALLDPRYGGFFNILDASGQPVGQDFKALVAHLRVLYVHAVAIARGHDVSQGGRLRSALASGLDFLEKRFWDPEEPGWLTEVSAEGFVRGRHKQMTSQVYVIYAMAEIHRLLGVARALEVAHKTFELLDRAGWDPGRGGYRNDHTKTLDDPANSDRDVGAQFHGMLALVRLWQAGNQPAVRDRLQTLYDLATTRFIDPDTGHGYLSLTPDWQPPPTQAGRPLATVYGHNVELIWYSLIAAAALGRDPAELRSWAEHAAGAFLRDGLTPDGAGLLFGHVNGPATDRRVAWWVPAESMIMFLHLWQITGDERYYRHFETVTRWTFGHIVDRDTGMWTAAADENGAPVLAQTGNTRWMGGLHVTRMLLEAERILGAGKEL